MKMITKVLSVVLACLMTFSSLSLAVDIPLTNESEICTAQKTSDSAASEITILTNDDTETSENESSAPKEDESTTTLPQEETTKSDVKLPAAPTNVNCEAEDGECIVYWDTVPMADGYDVFVKIDGEWVYNTSSSVHYTTAKLKGLMCGKNYEIGVRSFVIVNEKKYYSENITTCVGGLGDTFPYIAFQASVYFGGFNLKWNTPDCVSGYLLYIRQNNKWVKIATISDCTVGEYNYKFNDIKNSTNYKFAIKAFVKGDNGTKYGDVYTYTLNSGNVGKPELSKGGGTVASVTIKWNKIPGAVGYRVFKYDNAKKKYVALKTTGALEYKATGIEDGNKYYFKVRAYYKADGKTYWGSYSDTLKVDNIGKTKLSKAKVTSSAITLKWKSVEGAKGYRLYKYDSANKKYVAVKITSSLSYTVTGLNPSTNYTFKLRAYYKVNGETKWCTLSDKLSVVTDKKAVSAKYVSKYKKYFTDGEWSMKIGPIEDITGEFFYLTIGIKGDTICAKYDYKNSKIDSFRYLIQLNKGKVYLIYDNSKTYYALSSQHAYYITLTMASLVAVLDMSQAKNVTAETTYFSGKTGVIESYTDNDAGLTKRYTFLDGKMKYVDLEYYDGTSEGYSVVSVADKPAESLFKLPSNYKKSTY